MRLLRRERAGALSPQTVDTGNQRSWVAYEPSGWSWPSCPGTSLLAGPAVRSPTLVAGNAAVLKHSPNVTGCALAIEKLFRDVGLPADVFRSIVVVEADVKDITAPFVVLDDADLDIAVASAIRSRFINSGQSCLAAKRFIVQRAVADEFTRWFAAAVTDLPCLTEAAALSPFPTPDVAQRRAA